MFPSPNDSNVASLSAAHTPPQTIRIRVARDCTRIAGRYHYGIKKTDGQRCVHRSKRIDDAAYAIMRIRMVVCCA